MIATPAAFAVSYAIANDGQTWTNGTTTAFIEDVQDGATIRSILNIRSASAGGAIGEAAIVPCFGMELGHQNSLRLAVEVFWGCGDNSSPASPRTILIAGTTAAKGPCASSGNTFCQASVMAIDVGGTWTGALSVVRQQGVQLDQVSIVMEPRSYGRIFLITYADTSASTPFNLQFRASDAQGMLLLSESVTVNVVDLPPNTYRLMDSATVTWQPGSHFVIATATHNLGASMPICMKPLPEMGGTLQAPVTAHAFYARPLSQKPTHFGFGPSCDNLTSILPVREG